jgi:hypothetical protein
MSDLAYFRFLSYNLLTEEEKKDKEDIVAITEQVLNTKGMECDATISKISQDNLKEMLEDVIQIRKKKKKKDKEVEVSIEKQIEF